MWWAAAALAVEVQDVTPRRDRRPAVVVVTPGVSPGEFDGLVGVLVKLGFDTHVVSWGCEDGDFASMREDLTSVLLSFGEAPLVVSHGIGASITATSPHVRHHLWVAPVLDLPADTLFSDFRSLPEAPGPVDLTVPRFFRGHWIQALLVGDLELSCWSAGVASDLWSASFAVHDVKPMDIDIIVSLGDSMAPVERVVPRWVDDSRVTIHRLGLNSFASRDFNHGDLLVAPEVLREVRRIARRRR